MPWLLLVAAICTSLSGLLGYLGGRSTGVELERARHASEDQLLAKVAEQAALGTAAEIARIQVTQTTIRQRVETEIREKPVYRDCVHDQRVFDALNAALTQAGNTADISVPAADPARRPDVRGNHEQAVRGDGDLSGVQGGSAGSKP